MRDGGERFVNFSFPEKAGFILIEGGRRSVVGARGLTEMMRLQLLSCAAAAFLHLLPWSIINSQPEIVESLTSINLRLFRKPSQSPRLS